MPWSRPTSSLLWQAIDAYLGIAYAGKAPPSAVAQRLTTLRACPDDILWECPVFEIDDPASPTRFTLRLGNFAYPHMKLVVERSPDGKTHLFRADTHDRHIRVDADSRESKGFAELMQTNQKLAETIESAWTQRGVPTFKQYLRQDLERRAQAPAAHDRQP
jgi:hypothetical protein